MEVFKDSSVGWIGGMLGSGTNESASLAVGGQDRSPSRSIGSRYGIFIRPG